MKGLIVAWVALSALSISQIARAQTVQQPPVQPGYISLQPKPPHQGRFPAMAVTVRDRIDTAIDSARLPEAVKNLLKSLPTSNIIERIATRRVPSSLTESPIIQPFMANVGSSGGPISGYPGVALLLAREMGKDHKEPFCSGTLVSPDMVLTAAHCVCRIWTTDDHRLDGYLTAALCKKGSPERGLGPSPLLDPTRWGVFFQHAGLFEVAGIFLDDGFAWPSNGDDIKSDIAILKLQRRITWIAPAPIAPARNDNPFSQAVGVGFGFNRNLSQTETAAPIYPGLKGDGVMNVSACRSGATAGLICTTFDPTAAASAGICHADSGGPLWVTVRGELVGLASGSRTDPCAGSASEGLETRLSDDQNSKWLGKQMGSTTGQVGTIWPAFARNNLARVLDSRNGTSFGTDGRYTGAPVTVTEPGVLLATINSDVPLADFSVQDVTTTPTTACSGRVNPSETPYVNWCAVKVSKGRKFRIAARAAAEPGQTLGEDISLQLVIAVLPTETSMP